MHIHVTDHEGIDHKLEAETGWRVMEIIRDWDVGIKAECGGACLCATCHIYVDPNHIHKLEKARDDELDMLDTVPNIQENSRLSCQIIMAEALDGLKVTLAPGSEI